MSKSLVALACALVSSLSVASDAVFSQSNVTLSNFGYSVVDLTPSDGVAAKAYVGPANTPSLWIRTDLKTTWQGTSDGTIFDDGTLLKDRSDTTLPLTNAVLTSSTTGFSMTSAFTGSEANQYLPTNLGLANQSYYVAKSNDVFATGVSFSLQANTALVFEGDVVFTNSVDLLTLQSALQSQLSSDAYFWAASNTTFRATGSAYAPGVYGPNAPAIQYLDFSDVANVTQRLTVDGLLAAQGDGYVVKHFQLTITNNSNVMMIGSLDFQSSLYEMLAFSPAGLPVPEPGTWALMSLGLAGVMVTASRRKRLDARSHGLSETA